MIFHFKFAFKCKNILILHAVNVFLCGIIDDLPLTLSLAYVEEHCELCLCFL